MKNIRDEIRERYNDLFEYSLDLVFINDMNGHFIDANKITLETLGYDLEEFATLSFKDLMDKAQLDNAFKIIQEILETGSQSKPGEFKIKTKDGNFVYVETFGIPIKKKGEVFGTLGIAKNITELRNAQEKLKRSEKKYRFLFETTPFSVVLLNEDGIIIDCNPTTEKMFGYKKVEIRGRHFANVSILHQDFLPKILDLFIKLLQGEEVHRIDVQMYKKDGSIIWTNLQASIVKFGGKTVVQAAFQDITKRKKITQQLIESEDLYRTLVKTSPDAIVVTDLKGKIIEFSQKALELYGASSAEDLIGKNSVDFIIPENKKKALENLNKTLNGEIVKSEFKLLRKDGSDYICELHTNLIKDIDGKPKAFIGILRDITERKHAEELLKESEEQYRHLYENAPIALWTVRINDGKFIRANENAAKIIGYDSVEDFINNSTSMDIVGAEYRKDFLSKIKQESEISGIEAYLTDKKGREKYITMSAKLYDEEGYIEGVSTDITELKNAQKALQESEKKYRHLFDISPNMILLLEFNGTVVDVNKPFISLFGSNRNALIGINIFQSSEFFPKNRELFKKKLSQFLNKRIIKPFEIQIFDKDRNLKWVNIQASIIELDGKKLIQIILQDIDERKLAEQKLRESVEQYRTTIESFADPLHVIDKDFKIILFNHAFENWLEHLGFEKNVIGKVIFESFPFLPEKIRNEYEHVFKTGEPLISEEHTLINNEKFITETRKIPILREHYVDQVITIIRDITENKRVEYKLKESEQKYRHLFEESPNSYALLDSEGNFKDANARFLTFIGYNKEDLLGTNFRNLELALSDNISILSAKFEELSIKGSIKPFELQFQDKYEELRWMNIQPTLVSLSGQKLIQVILQDVTEKKKAEEDLKKSEAKFRRIFEAIPDFYFLISNDGTILDFKGKTEDFIIPPDQFVGNRISDLFPRDLIEVGMDKVKMTLESQQPNLIEYSVPIRGEQRHFEARILYISKDQVAIFVREITERKKAELLIQEEYVKLKELEQIRRDLISRVSHELKTPLIPVISGSELLRSIYDNQLGKEAREIIELIDKGGRRLKGLVEQLLNVSRIEYNKLELIKENYSLNEIVNESAREMRFILEPRELTLNIENSEELILPIDKIRIGEVITNLLSNAIKNTPPKGKINIKLEKQKNWAVLSVNDTGVGLTEREMHILFTRFGKIDRYNEGLEYIDIKGSGLGLYICKEIIELHEGQIWAESPGRNKGSTFFIKLPIN
ncbi:MAG: PAS domain-containing sensor histidine kinase [Promethearchaeota archaeon]|nr:MAG: PAS domain-containing sensor histidine kinase [Candidatus Lokiarchaeota archaeon]